jgi:hypothetical protein
VENIKTADLVIDGEGDHLPIIEAILKKNGLMQPKPMQHTPTQEKPAK